MTSLKDHRNNISIIKKEEDLENYSLINNFFCVLKRIHLNVDANLKFIT